MTQASHPPALSEQELLARTEEFNRAAEAYWRELRDEPSGRVHALNKPFGTVAEAPATVYRLGLVLAELHLGIGHTVLDFGAGSCWLASCLNRLGCRTIAIDVSLAALELGREAFALDRRHRPELEPRFLPYDGHRIPLPDASVDRVVCFDALHHVPNLGEVLSELFRVLREGGRAVLAEPGEGHSHAGHSLFDAERCGVLENELSVPDLERRARRAGFTDVRLKPYPDPGAISLGAAAYVRLMEGDAGIFPMAALQESLRQFFLVTLAKGEELVDSRNPRLLRAEIRRADPGGDLRGRGGAVLPVSLALRNTGDTLWRHEIDGIGGYVVVSGHLLAEDGRLVSSPFSRVFRTPLPHPVAPGESARVVADVPLPAERGRYLVRIDLVDERVGWFSQAGSPTLDVPVVIETGTDAPPAPGLRARLSTTSKAVGARPGTAVSFPVRLENVGRSPWPHAPAPRSGTVSLGGHLLDRAGRVVARDFLRLPLPRTVAPGEAVEVPCSFSAPLEPGDYRIELDLVMEMVCWFEERGTQPLGVPLVVEDETPDSFDPGLLRAALEPGAGGADTLQGPCGSTLRLPVRARNTGNTLWRARSPGPRGQVNLGGHLLDGGRRMLVPDFLRASLPRDVAPGENVDVTVLVDIPSAPGRYVIELDMVDEGIAWFGENGSPTLPVTLDAVRS